MENQHYITLHYVKDFNGGLSTKHQHHATTITEQKQIVIANPLSMGSHCFWSVKYTNFSSTLKVIMKDYSPLVSTIERSHLLWVQGDWRNNLMISSYQAVINCCRL